jgi:hypothetical protein
MSEYVILNGVKNPVIEERRRKKEVKKREEKEWILRFSQNDSVN